MGTTRSEGPPPPDIGPGDFRELVERLPIGAVVTDPSRDGRCYYVNPEFTRITGFALSELVDFAAWLERVFPDRTYRELVAATWRENIAARTTDRDVVFRTRCKDGVTRHLQYRARMLASGHLFTTVRDATPYVEARAALAEREQLYRAVVETTPTGIVVHSQGLIDYVNPAALRLFRGDRAEDFVGRGVLDFVHPEYRARIARRIQSIYDGEDAGSLLEEKLVRPDGSIVWAEIAARGVDYLGRPASLVVITDISERKRVEEERLAFETQLLHAQKLESLGVLAGGIAHDFNNLLMGILGRADLARLSLDRPDGPAAEHLAALDTAANRAAELARQLLAYSGRGQTVIEPVELRDLVEELTHLLDVTISKKARIGFHFAEQPLVVEGDATQLRQIVMNLIANASEALGDESGTIHVTAAVLPCDRAYLDRLYGGGDLPEGSYAFFEVSDTGSGIDPETLPRIFDPFYTTKFTGRGLGLAAVIGIVRAHRGAIDVESRPGLGTRFRVLLPLAGGATLPAARPQPGAEGWRATGTVLLVDDDETVRTVTSAMLEHVGLTVVTARDGCEAVQIFGEAPESFDCVLLDLTMPGMDGEELLRELKYLSPDVRVVLCSGYDEQDVARRFVGQGVAGFLQKPYDLAALAAALPTCTLA